MKIKLLQDVPVNPKEGMIKGRILETVERQPETDKRGVWVKGDIGFVKILNHEFQTIEE